MAVVDYTNLLKTRAIGIGIGAISIIIAFFVLFVVVIDAGTVGVVDTFGSVSDNVMQSGIHLKNPFSKIIILSTRTTSYTMSAIYGEGEVKGDDSISALAKDGGTVFFDISILFKLNPDKAPVVYKELGLNYVENIIRPQMRSVVRGVAARFDVNDIYATKRDEVQNMILTELQSNVNTKGLIVESVLLRRVSISQTLSDSIEKKLATEQDVQRLQYEIEKAKKDSEKKIIDAEAQKTAQQIINGSLTKNYLYYLYISQLKERVGTIYVPTDPTTGMPLFKTVE
jgi:regulator of protease activity HflC (stomatin/prohibitin superfamily)